MWWVGELEEGALCRESSPAVAPRATTLRPQGLAELSGIPARATQ